MVRRYRIQATDTPATLAKLGNGHERELYEENKAWGCSTAFSTWNPGMQFNIPNAWRPIPGEFPSE